MGNWLLGIIKNFFSNPRRVFVVCLSLALFTLIFEGTFLQLWHLVGEKNRLQEKLVRVESATANLRDQIKKAKDPYYLERRAREQFDLVEEDDLVFIFAKGE
jgi:cell division protein FtsB